MTTGYLEHFGIKGMHWGSRKSKVSKIKKTKKKKKTSVFRQGFNDLIKEQMKAKFRRLIVMTTVNAIIYHRGEINQSINSGKQFVKNRSTDIFSKPEKRSINPKDITIVDKDGTIIDGYESAIRKGKELIII